MAINYKLKHKAIGFGIDPNIAGCMTKATTTLTRAEAQLVFFHFLGTNFGFAGHQVKVNGLPRDFACFHVNVGDAERARALMVGWAR